jgi:hypothetical protein
MTLFKNEFLGHVHFHHEQKQGGIYTYSSQVDSCWLCLTLRFSWIGWFLCHCTKQKQVSENSRSSRLKNQRWNLNWDSFLGSITKIPAKHKPARGELASEVRHRQSKERWWQCRYGHVEKHYPLIIETFMDVIPYRICIGTTMIVGLATVFLVHMATILPCNLLNVGDTQNWNFYFRQFHQAELTLLGLDRTAISLQTHHFLISLWKWTRPGYNRNSDATTTK